MRHDSEPSVEEILESIKKVIARDNRESAGEERARRVSKEPRRSVVPEEVLELGADAELVDTHEEDDSADALIGAEVRDSMRDSFAALAMLSEPGAAPQIVRSGETSLEGMVREMLKPMLADWLDKNLPNMVEQMVAAEIARIAGKKG